MSELDLDPEARDVIAEGRAGSEPTSLQRARVRRRVQAELVAGAAALATTSSSIVAIAKIGAIAAVAAGVAGGGWLVLHHGASARPAIQAPAAPGTTVTLAARVEPVAPAAPTASVASSPATAVTSATPAARDSTGREGLAAEVALLARANGAVSRGDPNGALELLRQYDRRFPSGRLQAERAAAGVLALCGAGRSTQAQAAAERFQKRWPRSPLAARVASTCARASK